MIKRLSFILIIFILSCAKDTSEDNSLISDNSNSNPSNICTTPEDRWLYWTNVYDYDGNGLIDIFNTLNAEVVLHRWEWNGSKFIKKPYTNPFGY